MVKAQAASPAVGQQTGAVRNGADINLDKLYQFIGTLPATAPRIPTFSPPLHIKQFTFGQSNPTFLLLDSTTPVPNKVVVRKKPPGTLISSTAHAIEREFQVMKAVGAASSVPVPRVFALCDDKSIMGTPFFVMEFVQGRIFEDTRLPSVPRSDRRKYFHSAIDAIVGLHSLDIEKAGLTKFGRAGGYYARQLDRLIQVSELQAKVTDQQGIPVGRLVHIDESLKWLKSNLPRDLVSIVHGDFKMDNIVFDAVEPRVIALLDWELSTIGHPLSDLANMLMPWYTPQSGLRAVQGFYDVPRPMDVPEADELLRHYCHATGQVYPIPGWQFCVAFSFLRLAVIAQGIAARLKRGQASSASAFEVASMFQDVAQRLYDIVCGRVDVNVHTGLPKL